MICHTKIVPGIEPGMPAWESEVLPLDQTGYTDHMLENLLINVILEMVNLTFLQFWRERFTVNLFFGAKKS